MKRNLKNFVLFTMSGILAATALTAFNVSAAENISVNVDGNRVIFSDQQPVIVNERTMIPLRGTFEAMGADVQWDSENKSVTITKDDIVVTMTVGSSDITVTENGKTTVITSDTAAEILNSRVMVPVRAISEIMGAEVNWDSEKSEVTITTTDADNENASLDEVTSLAKIDNTKWQYNEEDGVYWQVGIQYCANPVNTEYETLGIFVPAAYMNATDNGDGTYTCSINNSATVGNYTAESAPVVIPINTPGYVAMKAPTDYVSGVKSYTDAGFIYVNAGCRGRDEGAPAGVTDLKAAVRYIRYNEGNIAGSADCIFTFGMSGGGAQSALMGATGDSELYTPYLEAIGAVEGVSDAVAGSMCWCPVTNLDYANEAYEWNMGISRDDLDSETQELSDGMAAAFAEYINELGLKDENGNVLTLEESENGIYQAGSYYDYIKKVIETSLNNFIKDTEFPYTPSSSKGFGNMGQRGERNGDLPIEAIDGIARNTDTAQEEEESVTYNTIEEYIASLNKDGEWIKYDSSTQTAEITSVEDFVLNCKNASKNVGAFDDLDCIQGENTLFGYGDGNGAHFDSIMAELLKDTEYGEAYASDLAKTDALGNTVDYRLNMYNPMYYLMDYYDGYKTSNVAKYWRIRTGINQGDTALSTEVNLALALKQYGNTDVDFETVWGQAHVEAERTGNSTDNFIAWVNDCLR